MSDFKHLLDEAEAKYGLPKGLLHAQMQAESGGNPRAVSKVGAQGLMQFMPATAKEYGIDPFDPNQAIDGAGRYMNTLMKRYNNDVDSAIGAYNWGMGNVSKKGLSVAPKETKDYIAKVKSGMAKPVNDNEIIWDEPSNDEIIWDEPAKPAKKETGFIDNLSIKNVPENAKNLVGAVTDGLAGIGQTISYPVNALTDIVKGQEIGTQQKDMRSKYDNLFAENFDTNAPSYKAFKTGAEVLGTWPVGGALGQVAQKAGASAPIVNSLTTGGMKLGGTTGSKLVDGLARMGGGAVTGGVSGGLIDPDIALTSAGIGAVLPPALQGLGKSGAFIKDAATGTAKSVLGATTGTSKEVIDEAFKAGRNNNTAFKDAMRGNSSFDDVIDSAKEGLSTMRANRGNQYRSGMEAVKNDNSVLDFTQIKQALDNVLNRGSYKGVSINKNATGVIDDMKQTIDQWQGLDPAQYHTPEGLDALKQSIGDIRDSTQFGTSARNAVDNVYNAIKGEITKQAPTYSKTMKDYADASKVLKEVEKTFSLGDTASKDTAVRKLQSILRNNVSSNYGNRTSLARQLEEEGGVSFIPSLAGQSMNSWMPRGMTGAIEKASIPAAAWLVSPKTLLAAPFASPRIVGESLYGMGRAASKADDLSSVLSNMGFLPKASAPQLTNESQYLPSLVKTLPALINAQNR